MVPVIHFLMLCVKSCLQPLQWQSFPYLPRGMSTLSPLWNLSWFSQLNSSLLNCFHYSQLSPSGPQQTTILNSFSFPQLQFLPNPLMKQHGVRPWRGILWLHRITNLVLLISTTSSPSLIHHSLPSSLACWEIIWLCPITQFFQT